MQNIKNDISITNWFRAGLTMAPVETMLLLTKDKVRREREVVFGSSKGEGILNKGC